MSPKKQNQKPMSAVGALDLGRPMGQAGCGNGEICVASNPSGVTKFELWAARIGFFTGGFTVASWAPLIPFVQSKLQLEPYVLGILLLGLGVGSFFGMPLAGALTQKIGARNAIGSSGLVSCLLLVLLAYAPGFNAECLLLLAYGVSLGCLEVSVNIYGTYLENKNKGRLMSGLHAAYSIGEVVSAAALTTLFVIGVTPVEAVGVLMATLAFVLAALLRKIENTKLDSKKKQNSEESFRITRPVVILSVLCAVIFLTEGSMLDWSAIYLRDYAGVPQEASAAGYTLFVIAMAISRVAGDKLTMRFGPIVMLVVGVAMMFASLLVLVLAPFAYASFASLFVMGLGIANVAPILISAASRTSGMASVRTITVVTTVGYGGLLAGPALIGAVSSLISLQGAFLMECGMLLVGLFLIWKNQRVFD